MYREDLFQTGFLTILEVNEKLKDKKEVENANIYILYAILRKMAKYILREERHHRFHVNDIFLLDNIPIDTLIYLDVEKVLTKKERRVLNNLLKGYTIKEIAGKMREVSMEEVRDVITKIEEYIIPNGR